MKHWFAIFSLVIVKSKLISSYLYPYETDTREVKSLNGLWNFKISSENDMNAGFREEWFKKDFSKIGDVIKMPVPSSYNDITTNATIRDFVGWAWYQRTLFIPSSWCHREVRIFLHFGSVHYHAKVFLNQVLIGEHEGGHLPFQLEVPGKAVRDINFLTVAVNNTLTRWTVPQGELSYPNNSFRYPEGTKLYSHAFDYFDYAGINRPVFIYMTSKVYVKDVLVSTDIDNNVGIVKYNVKKSDTTAKCTVRLNDAARGSQHVVAKADSCHGELKVPKPQLWWPVGMCNRTAGFLYTFEIQLFVPDGTQSVLADVYHLPVGIRSIRWTNSSLLINNEQVYLRGFGMHEDADIRGRGFDYAVMMRDMNLISWLGANAFRTSHYPYAEETIEEADARGFMVIMEAPACSLYGFDNDLLDRHKAYIHEMIEVYKNHPSIIMWSLANEPQSGNEKADYYFGNLSLVTKELDSTRPITVVCSQKYDQETAAKHVDVVCYNRYSGWYQDQGRTDLISYQVQQEVTAWHNRFNKPVIITEYGAGAVAGLHTLPETMWTEDYQVVTHEQHFVAFDSLRSERKLAGEMMWNFIDFNTPQEYIRPGRCSKGLFTRERQPKQAAHTIRKRYQAAGKCSTLLP